MANLPKPLRSALAEAFELRWPEVAERALSFDGTRKYLFRLDDGATIEAVYIPEDDRRTICISTQAGCPLKCAFCLTGIAGYKRNLKTWEILGQVATVMEEHPVSATHPHRRGEDPFPWNIVVMGMGEPLLNYEATVESLRILMDDGGFGVPPRKLTLSTVGILPALEKLAKEPVRPNLAISLHAPDPGLRRALMPIEEKYPFDQVVEAALRYPIPRGGLVTFEYVLLGGVNDTVAHARELARRLGGKRVKVNLIPLNPAPRDPVPGPDAGGRGRLRPVPRRGRRHGVRASAARSGHPRRLRPAPPQEGRARARPGAALSTPVLPAPRFAALPRAPRAGPPGAPAAAPRRGAARAGRDLLPRRRARDGRERRLGDPSLRGEALLRQADPVLLADGRRDGAARAERGRRAARPGGGVDRGRARDRLARDAPLRPALGPGRRAGAGHDPRVPVLRASGDVGHAARAVHDAGRRPRRPRVPARGSGLGGAAARRGGWPRLRDEGPGRAPRPGSRRSSADVGEPAPAGPVRVGPARPRRPRLRRARPRLVRARLPAVGNGAARRLLLPREPGALRRRGVRRGSALLVLPAGVPRGGPAVVAVPADRPVAPAALARRRRGAARAVPGALGGARPRAPEPLAREDRLLPPAHLPGPVARDRPLPRRRAVEAGRPRVGPPRPPGRGGGARPRPRPCRRGSPTSGCPGPCRASLLVAVVAAGAALLARRGRAPDAAPRRRRARLGDRRGVARARRLLPAGLRLRPAQPRDRGRRGAREVGTGPTCGWPSAPTRPG